MRWASARNQGSAESIPQKKASGLSADVPRARAFLRRLLLEADALPLVELFEVTSLDRIAVEKPLLTALVLDEPETAVPYQTFDGSVRHVDLRGPYGPTRSCIKFRSRSVERQANQRRHPAAAFNTPVAGSSVSTSSATALAKVRSAVRTIEASPRALTMRAKSAANSGRSSGSSDALGCSASSTRGPSASARPSRSRSFIAAGSDPVGAARASDGSDTSLASSRTFARSAGDISSISSDSGSARFCSTVN